MADNGGGAPKAESGATRNVLLGIIALILIGAALKATQSVTMPLAFAILLIALAWPLRQWLTRYIGPIASIVVATLAIVLFIAAFFTTVYYAVSSVVAKAPDYAETFQTYYQDFSEWLKGMGMPSPRDAMDSLDLGSMAQSLLLEFYSAIGIFFLILVLVSLGLPEVPMLEKRMRATLRGEERRHVRESTNDIVSRLQNFLLATVSTAGITGVATWGFAWAIGLDFAVVWGLMAFVLDFLPVIGSIISVVPPAIFALVQFDGWWMPLVVVLGIGTIQLFMGNVFYPNVVGYGVSLPPIVLIVSLTFWGWVWGIPGALLATPITVTLIIAAGQFKSTRWIARILERRDPEEEPEAFDDTSRAAAGEEIATAEEDKDDVADQAAQAETAGEAPDPVPSRTPAQGRARTVRDRRHG